MSTPSKTAGLACPAGGFPYICEGNATEFIGCCASDPCANGQGECPVADLRTTSFSRDAYASIPEQNCSDPRGAAVWYTCKFNTPPFLGCCASNPCLDENESCPQSNLLPAKLSSDPTNRAFFTAQGDGGSSQLHHGLSTGAIVGIAIGVSVIVIALVSMCMCRCGWWARNKAYPRVRLDDEGVPMINQRAHGHTGSSQGNKKFRCSFHSFARVGITYS